ncbi:hypothetical protein B0H16DRAFT_1335400, partial [Mycena metata]
RPAIRCLARRGGVKRISSFICEETRDVLNIFLKNVIRDSVTYTSTASGTSSMYTLNVVYAPNRSGRTLHGLGTEAPCVMSPVRYDIPSCPLFSSLLSIVH